MWIFEGILYVILLLVFIRYDRKKRLWIKTVSQEEKFEHYLSELSAAYGKQKNIEEAVAEVEESHTVTLPTEHSYVRIYGAMCAKISCSASRKCMVLQGLMFFPSFRSASCRL